MIFYCGSYTDEQNPKGITLGKLNSHTGEIQILESFEAGINPSYLFQDRSHGLLYAMNETGVPDGEKGHISTLKIMEKGKLQFLHQMDIAGYGPCYGLLIKSSAQILTADYGSGTLSHVELDSCGIPQRSSLFARFRGHGIHPERQEASHPHFLLLHDGEIFMTDLGMDVIRIYPVSSDGRAVREAREISFQEGSGPRWILPGRKDCLYVVEELASRISTWICREDEWLRVQRLSTLPDSWTGENLPAHMVINRRRDRLYCSNRGHDSLAVYDIEEETGLLSLMEHVSLRAQFPRYFALSPCGNFLLVAGQNNHLLESFRLNERGIPEVTGFTAENFSPSCVHFLQF